MNMRPIKFRVWDKNKWLDFKALPIELIHQTFSKNIPGIISLSSKYELMQFTGLLDKNGKEIYEGSILRFPTSKKNPISVVEWHNEKGQWRGRILNGIGDGAYSGAGNWFAHEVIGNIYEHPNLCP